MGWARARRLPSVFLSIWLEYQPQVEVNLSLIQLKCGLELVRDVAKEDRLET
jgi:hypothetical protein